MTEHDIKFEIEGLISLLAQNLYADPDVFLRELIQNAHDSIVKRAALAAERGGAEPPKGEIRITAAPPRSLRLSDNGAGLSESEIHEFLSTIGKSGTRELKERLRTSDHATAVELIGQFGIGLLSAFVVAERVEITTLAEGATPLRWSSTGGKRYELEPAERSAPGTEVTLHLRADSTRFLDLERLRGTARRYADFIGMPIFLGSETSPANAVDAPWHKAYATDKERHSAFLEYWESRFEHEKSLEILPIDETVQVSDAPGEGEPAPVRVRGVLGITDRHTPDVNSRGMVDLYIARMFIAQGHRDLLPSWARFIQGVIECNGLTPNAARDDVIKNSALAAVREALGKRILGWLTELSANRPERFIEVMRWHAYHVLAMAVQDEHAAFFHAVADLVPLESDSGPLALRDYLAAAPLIDGKRTLFYVTERGAATQFYVLCRARGIRVINAAEPFAERFLTRYAATWPERVRLSRVDVAGSAAIFTPLADQDPERERWRDLEAEYGRLFHDFRCIAKVSRFAPRELPAVLTESRDQKTRREMEEVAANVALPSFIRGMVGDFLKDNREPLQLHLNADNPTIQRLAKRDTLRDAVAHHALMALYNNALMLLSRMITPESVGVMFQQYSEVIEQMLALSDERARLLAEKAGLEARLREIEVAPSSQARARCITCFVAMPYEKVLDPVFEALRAVLEDVPYAWHVVRADSSAKAGKLDENVKRHLAQAHCFVADVSAENASVMLELGLMLATGKPVLLLRREDAPGEVPAHLKAFLYAPYRGTGSELVASLRREVQKYPLFIAQEGARKLTETVLRSAVKEELSEKVIQKMAAAFEGCRDLLDADAAQAAERLELKRTTIETAQECLRVHLDKAGLL